MVLKHGVCDRNVISFISQNNPFKFWLSEDFGGNVNFIYQFWPMFFCKLVFQDTVRFMASLCRHTLDV